MTAAEVIGTVAGGLLTLGLGAWTAKRMKGKPPRPRDEWDELDRKIDAERKAAKGHE